MINAESGMVNAGALDKQNSLEHIYSEIGYKNVEDAKREFEQHFKRELKLPLRVPPLAFTHHFGRFIDLDGDMNDSFEANLISEISPENHFKINVRPVNHRIILTDRHVIKVYPLKHQNEARYLSISSFKVLIFENNNWQYMFSVDDRVSEIVTPEILGLFAI